MNKKFDGISLKILMKIVKYKYTLCVHIYYLYIEYLQVKRVRFNTYEYIRTL